MSESESRKEISYMPRSYGSGVREGREKDLSEGPPGLAEGHRGTEEEEAVELFAGPQGGEESHTAVQEETGDSAQESESVGTLGGPLSEEPPEVSLRKGQTQAHRSSSYRDGATEPGTAKVIANVVGVRFNYACKVYYFDAGDLELKVGDWVIVKTDKGTGLGQVAFGPTLKEMDPPSFEALRKTVRKAGKVDFDHKARCLQREKLANAYCLERIEALGLPMKLVAVDCFFDGSKYVFYFTAEGRVDFRELVKQLVARFPVRIEMRQIGVRHEAKMTGGLACCGQELCCARFLTDFRPVSVRMAKNQNLSLNPGKISGVCGRLMCCLAYEHEIYEDFKRAMPRIGKNVSTAMGEGVVLKLNPLTETVTVKLDEETTIEVSRDEILANMESQENLNTQDTESDTEESITALSEDYTNGWTPNEPS